MTARPIVFLDTETLGLDINDPIWEIAAIRREVDGTETEYIWHLTDGLDQPLTAPDDFPPVFRDDFHARYATGATPLDHPVEAADELHQLFADRPTVVGAVPSFDTERLAYQLGVTGWHHRLRCVETLTAGYLGSDVGGLADCAEALGVPVLGAHTAMGDVRMCRAIWDAVMGAPRRPRHHHPHPQRSNTMTDLTHDWIAKREQLEQAAAPGPWHWEPPSGDKWPVYDESLVTENGDAVLLGWGYDASGIEGAPADREFIADARMSLPAALAALRAVLAIEPMPNRLDMQPHDRDYADGHNDALRLVADTMSAALRSNE